MRTELKRIFEGAAFDFGELALRIFTRQFDRCQPYRRFCQGRGRTPETVRDWTEIPHLPVTAFKHARIYSGEGEPRFSFQTSGTTGGQELRGTHWFSDLDLYAACAAPVFKRFVLPDRELIPMFLLAQPPAERPDSSLSWYLARQEERFGAPGGGWFMDGTGLLVKELAATLQGVEGPVSLLGTAFAFVHLVDCGLRFRLPPGSRMMETGGFKGKSREVDRAELYRLVRSALGSDLICINQYGMTEMSSNCYDQTLVTGSSRKGCPAWVRVRILDPESLREAAPGQSGLVAVTDLANLDSCAFLLTQDVGVQHPDGFEVLGRSAGAEARGCSIAMDQFLAANR